MSTNACIWPRCQRPGDEGPHGICQRHWEMLPREIRLALWDTHTPGQQADPSLASPRYREAERLAREWIRTAAIATMPGPGRDHGPHQPLLF